MKFKLSDQGGFLILTTDHPTEFVDLGMLHALIPRSTIHRPGISGTNAAGAATVELPLNEVLNVLLKK
jgi:hypothetical protein